MKKVAQIRACGTKPEHLTSVKPANDDNVRAARREAYDAHEVHVMRLRTDDEKREELAGSHEFDRTTGELLHLALGEECGSLARGALQRLHDELHDMADRLRRGADPNREAMKLEHIADRCRAAYELDRRIANASELAR